MKRMHEPSNVISEDPPDVDMDEEKAPEPVDDNDDDDDEDAPNETKHEKEAPDMAATAPTEIPFLDTFYGLAAPSAVDRARAAHAMLQHCLTEPATANTPDAAYALKRLVTALCSGRAAARQGNAAALATFLRLASASAMANTSSSSTSHSVLHAIQEYQVQQQQQRGTSTSTTTTTPTTTTPIFLSDLQFVRQQLLEATDHAGDTRTKGSQERDYQFGRLFGIVAVIKSGILVAAAAQDDNDNDDDDNDTRTAAWHGFATDLIALYHYKSWMREPAAHAICLLLQQLYQRTAIAASDDDDKEMATRWQARIDSVVNNVVVPQLLLFGPEPVRHDDKTDDDVLSSWSAEQLAVAMFLQSHHPHNLQTNHHKIFASRILSKEHIPPIATALSGTSRVTQPRTHLVWDVIWECLFEEIQPSVTMIQNKAGNKNNENDEDEDEHVATTTTSRNSTILRLRQIKRDPDDQDHINREHASSSTSTSTTVQDILSGLLQSVVMERLLGMDGHDTAAMPPNKTTTTTHERRALALCLVRNLLGVEFVSTMFAGRTKLILGADSIESIVLDPVLVQRLFIDVLGAGAKGSGSGAGGGKKQHQPVDHTLKPLATHVLESLVQAITTTATASTNENNNNDDIRLAVLRALLRCDPRFDARTKTNTIQMLLDTNSSELGILFWKNLVVFLQTQVLRAAPETGPVGTLSLVPHEATGYMDLIFNLGKMFARRDTSSDVTTNQEQQEKVANQTTGMTRRILDFFLVCAFFDCQNVKNSVEIPVKEGSSSSKKKKKKRKSKGGDPVIAPALEVAGMFKSFRSVADASCLPYQVRTVASARFFSLLSDVVAMTLYSAAVDEKESAILSLLTDVRKCCIAIKDAGGRSFGNAQDGEAMETDKEKSPEEVVEALHFVATRCAENSSGGTRENAKMRFANGLAVLSCAVFLHLLSCGQPTSGAEDDDPDADDEEDKEEIHNILSDLHEISEDYSKQKGFVGEDFFLGLAELCTSILSSPLSTGNQSRGASPTLLRESVKIVWTRALLLASTYGNSQIGSNVISVLLQSIGVAGVVDDEGSESGDESMDEGDEASGVFAKAADLSSDQSDDEAKEGSSSSSAEKQGEESDDDVELDPAGLQSLLEEENDEASVEEGMLEHHEGADAALAKLIQLKQEARKAGQKAKERLELTRQLRCTLLLDIVVSGKPDGWGSLLRTDLLLRMSIALLRYRNELEKSIAGASERGASTGEKRAMLDRVSVMLKARILKAKVASMEWSDDVDANTFTSEMATQLYKEARMAGSKDQRNLCSSAILLLIRATNKVDDKIKIAKVYGDAVEEWASKRTTRFESGFFDHLIHGAPAVAQASLPRALASATSTARSYFLKLEAFRLLSQLYNPKLSASGTGLEEHAAIKILDTANIVLEAMALALKDDEMKKTKRIREVLKTAERLAAFLSANPGKVPVDGARLDEVKALLAALRDDTDSQGVGNTCDKVIQEFDSLAVRNRGEQDGGDDEALGGSKKEPSKKKKSKSSKKEKR